VKLEGSCACGAVSFAVESRHPYPFNRCYCSICRKTAGGGGFAINLSGEAATLAVTGRDNTSIYRAELLDSASGKTKLSRAERHFCQLCATALWIWDPTWPELIHPFASAIDTALPRAPESTHLMLGSKKAWVEADIREHDQQYDHYPEESIADWHRRMELET